MFLVACLVSVRPFSFENVLGSRQRKRPGDVDPEVVAHLAKKLSDLSRRVHKATGAQGVLNIVANGEGAGQDVFHLHFHAIPRNKNSPFGFRFPPNYRDTMASRDVLDQIAEKIRKAI